MNAATTGPKLGVTLFCFTPEFVSRKYDLPQILARVAELGIGPGVEVIGHQTFRGFPDVDEHTVTQFRRMLDDLELEPSSLASLLDTGRRQNRFMDIAEQAAETRAMLRCAHRMGFSVMRVQSLSTSPEVMEAVLPTAERLGVALAVEIHAPHTVRGPEITKFREVFDRLNSPMLGFCPDFGASVERIPTSIKQEYLSRGVSADYIRAIEQKWQADHRLPWRETVREDMLAGYREILEEHGGGAAASEFAWRVSVLFGHQGTDGWKEIMPQILHVHGKFFEIDENGHEPNQDYPTLVRDLRDGGYRGYISSEWEGWHWTSDPSKGGGFDIVPKQHALMRAALQDAV